MLEIRIHGRGGQGAQVACQILAGAFFRAGEYVQAFAAYGGERRGAPVTAFLRVDERPIRIRCDIERPHYILVLDPTMLSEVNVAAGLREGGLMLVNAAVLPANALPAHVRVLPVDAAAIARRACLGPIVSTAMAGAYGIFCQEVRAALAAWGERRPRAFSFIAGLGGVNVSPERVIQIARHALKAEAPPPGPILEEEL